MPSLEEIRRRFQNDHFAMDVTGVVIDSAEPGKAVCSLALEERHMNENNVPMGAPYLPWLTLPAPLPPMGIRNRKPSVSKFPSPFLPLPGKAPDRRSRLLKEREDHRALCGGYTG